MKMANCLVCGHPNADCKCSTDDNGPLGTPVIISVGPLFVTPPVLTVTRTGVVTIKEDVTLEEAKIAMRMMGEMLYRMSV